MVKFNFVGQNLEKTLSLPSTVISVGSDAFAGTSLVKLVFQTNSKPSIGIAAFSNCTSLESVSNFPISNISDYTFAYCIKLSIFSFNGIPSQNGVLTFPIVEIFVGYSAFRSTSFEIIEFWCRLQNCSCVFCL